MPLGVRGESLSVPACPYEQIGVGREAICLLSFPLLVRLAFVFPGIVVGTQGFSRLCMLCR
jgi:hypothetical protein